MELVDLYDENRVPLGKTAERYGKKGPGEYRTVVHVCLFDRQGRMLIQRRTPEKVIWPGYWDVSVGGGVDAGETSRQGAEREFREELRGRLGEITTALGGLSDDIGDLQYERLSQAQDFYTSRGWCPGAKKEMLCKMHASYRAKGRNHLSEHYEEEILRLADKPEKEEDT